MKNALLVLTIAFVPVVVQSQSYGTLDSTFAANGVLQMHSNGWDMLTSTAIQPDGKIVAAGYSEYQNQSSFLVMRFFQDGSPDTDFGTNGAAMAILSEFTNEANAVAIQSDGKILIGGRTRPNEDDDEDFALVRFMPDGKPDSSFGQNGIATLDISLDDNILSIAVLSDGKILAAGVAKNNKLKFALAKFLPNGDLDTDFGASTGYTLTALGVSYDVCASMAVQPDGKILLAGSSVINGWPDAALVRYNSNGILDAGFGSFGIVSTPFSITADIGLKVALQPDGKIIVAGSSNNSQQKSEMALFRYLPNGALDTEFNGTGKLRSKIGDIYSSAETVVVRPDGKIIAAGCAEFASTGLDFAMKQFNPNGSVDNSFGTNGIVTANLNDGPDGISDIHFLDDGKILVTGTGFGNNINNTDLLILRYLSDLSVGVIETPQSILSPWVYPNPVATDYLTVQYEVKSNANVIFELYGLDGKRVATLHQGERASGEQTETLAIPGQLSDGFYLLNIQTGQGNAVVKILIDRQ